MMKSCNLKVRETLETDISDVCDVLVCGGGFAGISAALAAARCGKKVILLEKEYLLGGLGTAGLVTIYLPLCDGVGNQVSFGIAEELLRLSISLGAEGKYPSNWLDHKDQSLRTEKEKRFQVQYNPGLFAMLAEQLLIKEGVQILYGSYAVAVHMKESKIHAVMIENKTGRGAIQCGSVVDATGDCDIAHYAGAPTEETQRGNSPAAWYYSCGTSGYRLNMLGFLDVPGDDKEEHKISIECKKRFYGLDGKELSEYMQLSHASILKEIKNRKKKEDIVWPVTLATIPQIRISRKIVGEYILAEEEMYQYFEDSIGMIADWRKRGPVYEVPFRTLYSAKVKNLITAGRCVSVTEPMWDIMRVIPCCAVTGQAAGTAAAMTDDFGKMDISALQEILKENQVVLHRESSKTIS